MNWQLLEYAAYGVSLLVLGIHSLRLRDTRDDLAWRVDQQGWAFAFLAGAAMFGVILLSTAANALPDPPRGLVVSALSLFLIAAIVLMFIALLSLLQRYVARRNERQRQRNP